MNITLSKEIIDKLTNVEKKQYLLKLKVIKHLYTFGPTSALDLRLPLSASLPTIMSIISELVDEGKVEKYGQGESIGGRKPDLYRLRDKTFFVMSIHMERFHLRIALLDNNNNKLTDTGILPIEISRDLNALEALFLEANKVIKKAKIDIAKLLAVGISMPGLVSTVEGENYTYLLPDLKTQKITSILEKRFERPVYIQNDANAITLAERYFGQANKVKEALVLSVNWGIGLGIIMDYQYRSGISGFAGEFGHIPLVDDGLLCHCGKRGCLETVASGAALERMVKEGLAAGERSILGNRSDESNTSIEADKIVEAANEGDQFAISMLSKIGIHLGKGLSILIQLFNPQVIIIGGQIAAAKQFITTPIQQSINTYCMTQLRERTRVVLSDLGENAGILGGVATIMENIFVDQFELDLPAKTRKKKPLLKHEKTLQ